MRIMPFVLVVFVGGCTFQEARTTYIATAAGDLASTSVALSRGAAEANPLLDTGSKWSTVALGTIFAAGVLAWADWMRRDGHEQIALWTLRIGAVLRGGATLNNVLVARDAAR